MTYTLHGTEQDIKRIEEGTALLLEDLHLTEAADSLKITVSFQDEADLTVKRSHKELEIICREPAHYFRGLTWALHHLSEDSVEKTEKPYSLKNGFMLDCSRNAVFTVEKVKSMIRVLAKLGMNELMLYTEDTYTVPEEPYFGTYRGRYSQDEIREMDAYAQLFGVELVPCIQALAHLRNALKWPMGEEISDTSDILMVGNEKVYTFIEELLRSVKSSFTTNRVHLGMDEAAQLGLGEYLNNNGYKTKGELMSEHCSRVYAICEKLGLKPMIWSDMFVCSNTGTWYHNDDYQITDTSNWVKPVDGLGLVYWDYYNDSYAHYQTLFEIHKHLSDDVSFAGGAWIWNGISPNYSKAFRSTLVALKACREYQVQEVFSTAWLDNGAETPVDAVYPGLALFAHLGFHEDLDKEALCEEFENATGGRLEDFYQLDAFDSLFVGIGNNISGDNPSKYFLYQDAMLGMFDYHAKDIDTASYYSELAEKMAACQKTSPAYKDLFAFYELLARVLAQKADLGIRMKTAYDNGDLSTLKLISDEIIPQITDNLWKLKLLREELWLRDAKPFGYELMDIKLGGVITRLESHRRRIHSYLNGQVSSLEELEQPRLPFFTVSRTMNHDREESLCENKWDRIVSGCNLVDTL